LKVRRRLRRLPRRTLLLFKEELEVVNTFH